MLTAVPELLKRHRDQLQSCRDRLSAVSAQLPAEIARVAELASGQHATSAADGRVAVRESLDAADSEPAAHAPCVCVVYVGVR